MYWGQIYSPCLKLYITPRRCWWGRNRGTATTFLVMPLQPEERAALGIHWAGSSMGPRDPKEKSLPRIMHYSVSEEELTRLYLHVSICNKLCFDSMGCSQLICKVTTGLLHATMWQETSSNPIWNFFSTNLLWFAVNTVIMFIKTASSRLLCHVLRIVSVRVRFPALPEFLRSSGSRKGSIQPRENNWGATWMEK
jgi:hypothetical protein